MSNKTGKILDGMVLASLLQNLQKTVQLRALKVSMALVFLVLATGCEPKVIKFKIVSQNGETHFAVPAEMINKCCRPENDGDDRVSVDIDKISLGGKGYYSLTLLRNGNNNSLVTKTMPDRVKAAEEVTSDFPAYKKYVEHNRSQDPFLLVGKRKSGENIYLQCHHGHKEIQGCTYYGIFDEKLAYEFRFPGYQIDDVDNFIDYSKNEINKFIVKE